ncbi:(d)CMP kinase [Nocardia goodfellowii]
MAQQLRLPYFNAGLLYRALALWCVNEGLARDNTDGAVADAAHNYPVLVSLDTGSTVITLAGEEVSSRLKTDEISRIVPEVARHAEVREIMTARQRAVVSKAVSTFEGVVIDGRDATTVVVPDADVKILLVADHDARAARIGTPEGGACAVERDAADSLVSDFLRPRHGVAVFDTSHLRLEDLVPQVLAYIYRHHPAWRE